MLVVGCTHKDLQGGQGGRGANGIIKYMWGKLCMWKCMWMGRWVGRWNRR
jgi:hypothetical protein